MCAIYRSYGVCNATCIERSCAYERSTMVGVNAMDGGGEYSFHSPPVDDENPHENDENEDEVDDMENEEALLEEPEVKLLNEQIEQLNSCLDRMERQNDVLKAELLELLESNRQTRKEMAEERERVATPDDSTTHEPT